MIKVFLETSKKTTSEYVFIRTLLLKVLQADSSMFKIECVDGKDNLSNAANMFKINTEEGGKNLLIFDADTEENGGGYKERKTFLENKLKELNIEADIFLFPNNADDGDFECLLEKLALTEKHKRFFDCFSDYEHCLGTDYVAPNRKGKLHTYISSMRMSKTKRDRLGSGEWQFDNTDYWDLNHLYLQPLKDFLQCCLR